MPTEKNVLKTFSVTLHETKTTVKTVNVPANTGMEALSIALNWAQNGRIPFNNAGIVQYKAEDVKLTNRKKSKK